MVGRRQVVVAVGVAGVLVDRLVELLDGVLITGLLEQPDALGVLASSGKPTAAGRRQYQQSGQC